MIGYRFVNFRNIRKSTFVFFCFLATPIFAQKTDAPNSNGTNFRLHKKGNFYFNWGYNRAWFNKSDIHFSGQGHDFTLYDVKSNDRPSALGLVYINPKTWSIPQLNCRVGYLIADKYSLSLGWDHMKYVAVNYQTVRMDGFVNPDVVTDPLMKTNMEALNARYSNQGIYTNMDVQMEPTGFIRYEHTDGLNYVSADVERFDELWQHKIHDRLGVTLVSGIGAGLIIPRTDAHLFGSGRNHFWNVSGWGTSAKIGLQVNLSKHIYLQSDFKCGYLQMIKIHTTNYYGLDKAQQHIVFYENYWQVGFRF